MKPLLIGALTLLCGACQTTNSGQALTPNQPPATAKRLKWFEIASYIRRCDGPGSVTGAVWAATASSIGAIYYVQTGPRSIVTSPEGRRRVSALMDAGYKGRYGNLVPRRQTCARVVSRLAALYRRQSESNKNLIGRLAGTLLRTDGPGRAALAQVGRSRTVSRRTYLRRAARVRRATLKPSEQQLPIGE